MTPFVLDLRHQMKMLLHPWDGSLVRTGQKDGGFLRGGLTYVVVRNRTPVLRPSTSYPNLYRDVPTPHSIRFHFFHLMVQAVKPVLTLHTDSIISLYFLELDVLSVYTAESFWQLLFIRSIQMVYPVLLCQNTLFCTSVIRWLPSLSACSISQVRFFLLFYDSSF